MAAIADGVEAGAQLVIATHSPLLMALPGAEIFELTSSGIAVADYDELEIVGLWRSYLDGPERFLRSLPDD